MEIDLLNDSEMGFRFEGLQGFILSIDTKYLV